MTTKRYYLSTIIGDGTEENPYRSACAAHGVNFAGMVSSDPETGLPNLPWSLVIVSTASHAALLADPNIESLPDFPLDGKTSAISTDVLAAMLVSFQRFNIPATIADTADGYNEVIRGIGRLMVADFDEKNLDITV